MKRWCLMLSVLWGLAGESFAQESLASQTFSISDAGFSEIIRSAGASYHQISWRAAGTVTACVAQLQRSEDGLVWVGHGASRDCSVDGSSPLVSGSTNYIRVNTVAWVGTGSVEVTWTGYTNRPVFLSARTSMGSIAAGARAEAIVTWPGGMPEAVYTFICGIFDSATAGAGLIVERTLAVDRNSVKVQVLNQAGTSRSGMVGCIGVWP